MYSVKLFNIVFLQKYEGSVALSHPIFLEVEFRSDSWWVTGVSFSLKVGMVGTTIPLFVDRRVSELASIPFYFVLLSLSE